MRVGVAGWGVLAWGLVALGGCAYDVQQSSLVPAAVPPPPTTHEGRADVYAGHGTVVFLSRPELAPNSEAGLWIPRHQVDGQAGFRLHRRGRFRLHYRESIWRGAMKAAPTTLPNPRRDAHVMGTGYAFRAGGFGEPWMIDFGFDLAVAVIPSWIHAEPTTHCTVDCVPRTEVQIDAVPVFGTWVSWRQQVSPVVALRLGMTLQTHPTNQQSFGSDSPSAKVYVGAPNLLLDAGAELRLTDWLRAIVTVTLPTTAAPVRYGPILGFGLRAVLEEPRPASGRATGRQP